ncbi:MAG: hypothetical protein ABIH72_00175 [archaeon]
MIWFQEHVGRRISYLQKPAPEQKQVKVYAKITRISFPYLREQDSPDKIQVRPYSPDEPDKLENTVSLKLRKDSEKEDKDLRQPGDWCFVD